MALFAPSPYGKMYEEIEGEGAKPQADLQPSPYEDTLYKDRDEDRIENPSLLTPYANWMKDRNAENPKYEKPEPMQGALSQDGGEAAKGEVATPDLLENPAAAVASTTYNRSVRGSGMGNREIPKAPDQPQNPKEAGFQAQELESKRIAFDQNKIPKWYESQSFSLGLISFGLNMMSGNNAADSFNAAGKVFDEGFGKEKREAWADELRSQGYDDNEIMSWIQTGDNKELTDPTEKKMKNLQYQMSQYNLENARYDANEGRQSKAAQQNFDNQMRVYNAGVDADYKKASLGMQREGLDLKYKELERKAEQTNMFGMDKNYFKTMTQNAMPFLRDTQVKMARGGLAKQAMDKLKTGKNDDGTPLTTDQRWSLYNTAQEALGKAYQGGYGALSPKVRDEYVGDPSAIGQATEWIYKKTTGNITDSEIDRVSKLADGFMDSEHASTSQVANQLYNSVVNEIGPENAMAYVRGLFQTTNMGDPSQYIRGQSANKNTVTIQR